MRSTRGQATLDYVALIALLAILSVAALAAASGGAPGIVNAFAGQVHHALCVVAGDPCPDLTQRPCTVATTRDAHHVAVNILLLRIDHNRYVLRERMSNGTVRLTVARSGEAGAEVGVGARVSATAKGRQLGAIDEARGGVQAVLGLGRVFVARDAREADAFMRAIRAGRSPAAPREVFVEGGIRGVGSLGIGASLAGASLEGFSGTMIGARRDRRTGDVTLTLSAGAAGWGAVTVVLGGSAGTADRATTLGLTLDRHRRPIELSLSAGGTLAAGAALPLGLPGALGGGSMWSVRTGGRRWELTARLDLRDPVVAAAWAAVRHDPGSGSAIRALGETIRDRAHLDVRAYRTDSTSSGAAAGISDVVGVGGALDRTVDRSRLLAAASRPPGGLWERRLDCLRS
jgi:hypothetical protein